MQKYVTKIKQIIIITGLHNRLWRNYLPSNTGEKSNLNLELPDQNGNLLLAPILRGLGTPLPPSYARSPKQDL
jgi:hypothetical protein